MSTVNLNTVLGTITAIATLGVEEAPAVLNLVTEVKQLFNSEDQATIDDALAQLDKTADDQHDAAQKL